jgi:hypothetical protein
MTYRVARTARIGFVIPVTAIMVVGICGDAVAKAHKGHLHARSHTFERCTQLVWQQPAPLGPMRYYGGPKSPMWR